MPHNNITTYFKNIEEDINKLYSIARTCRQQHLDPVNDVEVVLAKNMAERVVGLISVVAPELKNSHMVERIKQLEQQYGAQDWRVALTIALETAQEKFVTFSDKLKAMEIGIRVGIAYITNGVVSSPLEGFTKLEVKHRRDNGEYLCLYFSGPIRSAGGTAASVSVIIGDYIRKNMGYQPYDPTPEEIKRIYTELLDYHEKVTNLQYLPSEPEADFLAEHLPVQVDGDPSEKFEVSNYKNLDRIEANRLRNGVCLVYGEGIAQKAQKLKKKLDVWGKDFGLEHWKFLDDFIALQKSIKAQQQKTIKEEKPGLKKDYTFIKDLVAGRPILTRPLGEGGFRLRYGRTRTTGLSAQALHPATLAVLNNFIAIGTQLKVERPGKSTVISVCDELDGPIIKLKDGSVLKLHDEHTARKYAKDIQEILYLGDLLICYGDFFDRGHVLAPPGYCEEWWALHLERALNTSPTPAPEDVRMYTHHPFTPITFARSLKLSTTYNIPLHPRYTYFWDLITKEQLHALHTLYTKATHPDHKIILPYDEGVAKRTLELLGIPHKCIPKEYLVIEGEDAHALAYLMSTLDFTKEDIYHVLNKPITIKKKGGTFIGARMGRPEKSKMRKLTGSPQVLFPVGSEGGRLRSFQSSLEKGTIKAQFPVYHCKACNKEIIYPSCTTCNMPATKIYTCMICGTTEQPCHDNLKEYKEWTLDITDYFNHATNLLKINRSEVPELIKGVRGTSNKNHTPEHLAKGILRALHKIYVNKDGTTRYDMTEMPITHFKPQEIGTSVAQLKQLGYEYDLQGQPLEREDQLVELFIQDVILPSSLESLDETADKVFYRVAHFTDDLLTKLYHQQPFYKIKEQRDLIGHYVMGLAPHISAGIVGRIIGFSTTQAFYAHPYFHSIVRRDCDGDEVCVMLLLDALINFSREYLPAHRGSTQDAPLVLTSIITPSEVDDMVFNMDVAWKYPLELYEAAEQLKNPWEVKIEQLARRLGKEEQFHGLGYTHNVAHFGKGVQCSAYKSIPTMEEKVDSQMDLAHKIRAVDEEDVARLIIERHFIRDIKGNLRKFSMQQFRCVKCNEKYRRPPLFGCCLKCRGNIIFTIAEGSIIKYLEPSLKLAEKYHLSTYLKQTLELTKMRIESIFGKEHEKQEGLHKFFG